MPQPISVALVIGEKSQLGRLKRKFRLGMPGMGSAYYCALDSDSLHPDRLPNNSIHLWLAMDNNSLAVCRKIRQHSDRGFYSAIFPEEVVKVSSDSALAEWKLRIEEAYLSTS